MTAASREGRRIPPIPVDTNLLLDHVPVRGPTGIPPSRASGGGVGAPNRRRLRRPLAEVTVRASPIYCSGACKQRAFRRRNASP
jgi:hypothetical protein